MYACSYVCKHIHVCTHIHTHIVCVCVCIITHHTHTHTHTHTNVGAWYGEIGERGVFPSDNRDAARGHSGLYPHPRFHYQVCFVWCLCLCLYVWERAQWPISTPRFSLSGVFCVCVCVCMCVCGRAQWPIARSRVLSPTKRPRTPHEHTQTYIRIQSAEDEHDCALLGNTSYFIFFLFSLLDFFVVLRTSIHDCAPSWKRFSPWFGILAASPPSRAIPAMLLRRCSHPLFSFSCPIFFLLSCNEWRRHPPALYQRCFWGGTLSLSLSLPPSPFPFLQIAFRWPVYVTSVCVRIFCVCGCTNRIDTRKNVQILFHARYRASTSQWRKIVNDDDDNNK